MEQVFIDKIQSMVIDKKSMKDIVETLFNMGCPDSIATIFDIASEEETKMDTYMADMLNKNS